MGLCKNFTQRYDVKEYNYLLDEKQFIYPLLTKQLIAMYINHPKLPTVVTLSKDLHVTFN